MKMKIPFFVLCILCLAPLFCSCEPEDIPLPEDQINIDYLYGKWNQEHTMIYYRYNEDGTGCTWDEADDITEDEAQRFTWEVDGNQMIHIHLTETGTAKVPKQYIITSLSNVQLSYYDAYNTYTFHKVLNE